MLLRECRALSFISLSPSLPVRASGVDIWSSSQLTRNKGTEGVRRRSDRGGEGMEPRASQGTSPRRPAVLFRTCLDFLGTWMKLWGGGYKKVIPMQRLSSCTSFSHFKKAEGTDSARQFALPVSRLGSASIALNLMSASNRIRLFP